MQPAAVPRAVAAALATASGLGLTSDDAVVLQQSNRLTLRLLPSDVVARVAQGTDQAATARFEIELARRLAESESPVAGLETRVAPALYQGDGFVVTLWTHHQPLTSRDVAAADDALALERLHAGMRTLDVTTPHWTDRVAEAQALVASSDRTPALSGADRALLSTTLHSRRQAIADRAGAEQLLHGEPHPGNLLSTRRGPLFVDLESCCRGPVAFDPAHVPEAVSDRYPDVDRQLLSQCRILVLAMVAAWRWDRDDQLPNGRQAGRELVSALRHGPPWPTLDEVMGRPT